MPKSKSSDKQGTVRIFGRPGIKLSSAHGRQTATSSRMTEATRQKVVAVLREPAKRG